MAKPRTDYKFWYIKRDDAGFITEATVRFYEGDFAQVVNSDTGQTETRYVRVKRLGKDDLKHLNNAKFKSEESGTPAKLYDAADFGSIKTDAQLCAYLNGELAKDSKRNAIEGQK